MRILFKQIKVLLLGLLAVGGSSGCVHTVETDNTSSGGTMTVNSLSTGEMNYTSSPMTSSSTTTTSTKALKVGSYANPGAAPVSTKTTKSAKKPAKP